MRLVLVTLLAALAACASRPPRDARVVEVSAMEKAFEPGKQEPFIMKFPAGTRLPVDFDVQTPFVRSDGGKPGLHLVFDRTVYWYPALPSMLSFDGETWARFDKLYQGKLNFSVTQKDGAAPRASVSVRAADREK